MLAGKSYAEVGLRPSEGPLITEPWNEHCLPSKSRRPEGRSHVGFCLSLGGGWEEGRRKKGQGEGGAQSGAGL